MHCTSDSGRRQDLSQSICSLGLGVCMLLAGCNGEKVLFTELAGIGGDGWAYSDSIRFSFDVSDTSQVYRLQLEVAHDPEYAWENVYVRILTAFPDDSVKTDILSLELSDGAGAWQGQCSGSTCRLGIPLQARVRFPMPGTYGLTFVQHMRQEVVPGIDGFRLSVIQLAEDSAGRLNQ